MPVWQGAATPWLRPRAQCIPRAWCKRVQSRRCSCAFLEGAPDQAFDIFGRRCGLAPPAHDVAIRTDQVERAFGRIVPPPGLTQPTDVAPPRGRPPPRCKGAARDGLQEKYNATKLVPNSAVRCPGPSSVCNLA